MGNHEAVPAASGGVPWHAVVAAVEPYVVRLSTPGGWGTGFLLAHSKDRSLMGVATAAHVVQHAHMWEDPIRLDRTSGGQTCLVRHPDRVIAIDVDRDSAVIVTSSSCLALPTTPLTLAPKGLRLKVGEEVGWLGFPAMPAAGLCFFSGRVSAWVEPWEAYLVDGNAINGVSGGPAFALVEGGIHLFGMVAAYMPNRASGETLPGLALVRSVERLHQEVATIASFEQARTGRLGGPAGAGPADQAVDGPGCR